MSSRFNTALKSTVLTAFLLSFNTSSVSASEHPHEKDLQEKAASKTDTNVKFEDDLNAHFERHAKSLREALQSAQSTKSQIITKEFKTGDEAALPNESHSTSKRIEIIENPDELRAAARSIQNMLAESSLLENLANAVIDLAEDIQIDDTGDGMRLSFNGTHIGGFSMDEENQRLTLETMGGNTSIEKEIIVENGKKKTRIVIETDSEDVDFDIVPKAKSSSDSKRDGTEF